MKKVLVLFAAAAIGLGGCKDEKMDTTYPSFEAMRGSDLLGQWKFKGYSDGKTPKFDVTMEIKNEKDKVTIYGRSSVNFYFAEPMVDENKRTFRIPAIGSTKIAGTPDANSFEFTYYESLRNVEKYDLKDRNIMVFYVSSPANEALYFEKK